MKRHPKRLEISWLDAVYSDDSPDTEGMLCKEIGYFVKATPTYIEIAREWGPETGEFRFHMKIPKAMITKLALLKPAKQISKEDLGPRGQGGIMDKRKFEDKTDRGQSDKGKADDTKTQLDKAAVNEGMKRDNHRREL